MVFAAVCMDDVLITGDDIIVAKQLETFWVMSQKRQLNCFLRLEVLYETDGVVFNQRKFTMELISECDCSI